VVNFYLLGSKSEAKVFMKLDTQVVDGFFMVVVSLQSNEEVPYLIRNRTKELIVEVPALGEKVMPGGMSIFSWKDPYMNRNL